MYSTRTLSVASMLVALVLLPGCSRDASAPAAVVPTAGQLQNATYIDILEGPVTLVDGRFEGKPFVPGAATRPVVTLVPGLMATGDLTGDTNDEAAVALAHNAGGSGVFMHLAVVGNHHGKPDNFVTIALGDRIRIDALDIAGGKLIANLVTHSPDDPMCCPTQQVRREWRLQDGLPISVQPAVQPQDGRVSGHLVWGHESRSFAECGDGREGWVINEAGDELVEVYNELTTTPYQPMFVEVRGEWTDAPTEGFGAEFDQALRITELLRAENEGFGCRLALDGVLFVASGNEPSWRLQIREDGISMRTMGAPEETVFAAPGKRGQPPLVTFESSGADSPIRITLEQRRCVDSMSGARFAWAASVDIGGRQLTGCAAEGL